MLEVYGDMKARFDNYFPLYYLIDKPLSGIREECLSIQNLGLESISEYCTEPCLFNGHWSDDSGSDWTEITVEDACT